eukprot:GDKI01035034.1.p1 GENE.GDKI01035034.1~~GDKI01035034.1.p1  ORF type:complete len:117 (+),score=38.51 GDKI01035034.1:207-557(+)
MWVCIRMCVRVRDPHEGCVMTISSLPASPTTAHTCVCVCEHWRQTHTCTRLLSMFKLYMCNWFFSIISAYTHTLLCVCTCVCMYTHTHFLRAHTLTYMSVHEVFMYTVTRAYVRVC